MKHPDPMTSARKEVIWERWRSGTSVAEIAREIGKPPATVFSYLWYHGGIKPRERSRSALTLTSSERETISRGLAAGESLQTIAARIDRSPSTICREVKRNSGRHRYRALDAEKAAWKRARRPKPLLLCKNLVLKRVVVNKLTDDWSPEQIAGWLKLRYSDDESMRVSHETIYRSLFIQTRGLFKNEMRKHLRTKRKFRHSKNHKAGTRGRIVNGIPISDRPAEVEDRAVLGHWEGDIIAGSNNSYIALRASHGLVDTLI